MMSSESSSPKAPLPMDSLSADWLAKQILSSIHSQGGTASVEAPSTTSLDITIVTIEEIPVYQSGMYSNAMKTVERKIELSLTLPASYNGRKLKSFNVKLNQNVLKPSPHTHGNYNPAKPLPVPVSSSINSKGFSKTLHNNYHNKTMGAHQQWQQTQHQLFHENQSRQAMLPAVVPSQDFMANANRADTPNYFAPHQPDAVPSSAPLPETVSSSISVATPDSIPVVYHDMNINGNKRRRPMSAIPASQNQTISTRISPSTLSTSSTIPSSSILQTPRKKRKGTTTTGAWKQ